MRMKPKEVIRRIKADGWVELPGKKTSHKQFKHSSKPGKVTVPFHNRDINLYTLKNIENQSGVSMA
jgi:predicted RNA binding protein YcfA (HicA-like mRNA interferase family)